jgi:ribosomal-protein-alanine N-acetyltransferase
LKLRPVEPDDALFFDRLLGNEEVRKYLGGPVPKSDRDTRFRAYLRGAAGIGIWIVCTFDRQAAIGLIVLSPHKDGAHYEISYEFHPDHWRKGFAFDATSRALVHALSDTPVTEILAETQSANHASVRLLQKLGMAEIQRQERFGAEQIIMTTRQPS